MKNIKSNKGITLIALVTTIVILIIIAAISINSGKSIIKQAKLESLRTNMLLIEAKAKGCVEEATFKMGRDLTDTTKVENAKEEVYRTENKLELETDSSILNKLGITGEAYKVTEDTLDLWGLEQIERNSQNDYYIIKFDETTNTAEVYNTVGFDNNYSLTQINELDNN